MLSALAADILRHPSRTGRISAVGLVLLSLYLVGGFLSSGHHHHAHEELSGVHFDHCGEDPCHVAVYHPGLDRACNHKAHVTRGFETDCPLCDMLIAREDIPPSEGLESLRVEQLTTYPRFYGTLISIRPIGPSGRGPPLC